jgi:N-methylhydantoinase B
MELESPILVERLEYAIDSGGPGRFRGGLGVRKDYRALRELYVGSHSNRHRIPGPGMRGGKSGHGTSYVIDSGTSTAWMLPRNCSQVPIAAGQRVTITTGGGGGYGHPFERDPKLVLQDVVNGFVSRESAERDYGVVIDVAERRVDEATTRTLREGQTLTGLGGKDVLAGT